MEALKQTFQRCKAQNRVCPAISRQLCDSRCPAPHKAVDVAQVSG